MPFDVIAVGSACVDVFVKTDAETVEMHGVVGGQKIDLRLLAYPLGSKIVMSQLDIHTGGGGTNVAATFSKLGLKTGFVGKVGSDQHGPLIMNWLAENTITFLGQRGGQTGYSVILDSQADDRTILVFKGCNNDLCFDELRLEEMETQWLYASAMVGTSYNTLIQLMEFAKSAKICTAFNPAHYIVERGLEHVKPILKNIDVLILNKEEAECLVGDADCSILAEKLTNYGPRIVAVTDGPNGVTLFASSDWTGGETEKWHIGSANDLQIIETTGAGDAFSSGFVSGLIIGKTIKDAALMGVFNAEGVVQAYGCKSHIADRQEMEGLLETEKQSRRHEVLSLATG